MGKLKKWNQKNAVCDGTAVEMIKHVPKTIDQKIRNIFNNMVQTADVPGNYFRYLKRSNSPYKTYDK